MATSKLELFQTEITIERNAMIDDIDTYLNTCQKTYTADNFQYQQLASNMTFVIALPQSKFQGKTNIGNYVRLTQDNKEWYFFINSISWQSMNACSLNCLLDTINTFKDLVFSDETSITREHKNRVLKVAANKYYRIVDKESEGIYPLKYQVRKDTIYDEGDNLNWYLIYSTRDDLSQDNNLTNPVSCYMCADKVIYSGTKSSGKSLVAEDFSEGTYYYYTQLDNQVGAKINPSDNNNKSSLTLGNSYNMIVGGTGSRPTLAYRIYQGTIIKRVGQNLYVLNMYDNNVAYIENDKIQYNKVAPNKPYDTTGIMYNAGSDKWRYINSLEVSDLDYYRASPNYYTTLEEIQANTNRFNIDYTMTNIVYSINEVDRTDSKLMKIILLPYCPVEYTHVSGTSIYNFASEWQYENGLLKLTNDNLATEFINTIERFRLNELVITDYLNPNRTRNIQWESKLYHSDYYTNKLTYDSYSIDIPLENLYYKQEVPDSIPEINIDFKPTNTINSNMLFALDYKNSSEVGYTGEYDYDNIMIVSRNNEEPIFNNGYVDYIRTGYNYDKKMNAMQITQQLIGGSLSALASGTSFAVPNILQAGGYKEQKKALINQGLSFTTGNGSARSERIAREQNQQRELKLRYQLEDLDKNHRAQLAGVGIPSAFGVIGNVVNTTFGAINSLKALEQKKTQLASQSTSVSGSNDIDLLKYYNGNKLENFRYDIKSQDKRGLYTLFNYAGYLSNERKAPRLDSRYWFNFIQCSPIFKHENLYPYNDYLDDIKSRYESGITIYHTHNGKYDFDREKENAEVDCLLPNLIDSVEVDDTKIMWTYRQGYDFVDDGQDTYWVLDINDGDYVYDTQGIDNCQVFDYDKSITGTINKITLRKYNSDWDLYSKEYVWNREE